MPEPQPDLIATELATEAQRAELLATIQQALAVAHHSPPGCLTWHAGLSAAAALADAYRSDWESPDAGREVSLLALDRRIRGQIASSGQPAKLAAALKAIAFAQSWIRHRGWFTSRAGGAALPPSDLPAPEASPGSESLRHQAPAPGQ